MDEELEEQESRMSQTRFKQYDNENNNVIG